MPNKSDQVNYKLKLILSDWTNIWYIYLYIFYYNWKWVSSVSIIVQLNFKSNNDIVNEFKLIINAKSWNNIEIES